MGLAEKTKELFKKDYPWSFPLGFTELYEEIDRIDRIAQRVSAWNADLREGRTFALDKEKDMCLACSNYLLGTDQSEKKHKMFTCSTECRFQGESTINPELNSFSKQRKESTVDPELNSVSKSKRGEEKHDEQAKH